MLLNWKPIILGTIHCDFDKDKCGFTTHSDGDDASKQGFNWIQHSASWVTANNLEGPSKGTQSQWFSIEINYVIILIPRKKEWKYTP